MLMNIQKYAIIFALKNWIHPYNAKNLFFIEKIYNSPEFKINENE